MTTVRDVVEHLARQAPLLLAEPWDNIGLLLGDAEQPAERIMTCLTVTESTVDEAVRRRASLIVTHHPILFRPVQQLTSESTTGRLLGKLMRHSVTVASFHTAFDSTWRGINQLWAEKLQLQDIRPLRLGEQRLPGPDGERVGAGRFGLLPRPLRLPELAALAQQIAAAPGCKLMPGAAEPLQRVAIGCGSAGELMPDAVAAGCQVMLTGEVTFHTALEAQAQGLALILVGHYASERLGVEQLADDLAQHFHDLAVWASQEEADPFQWVC